MIVGRLHPFLHYASRIFERLPKNIQGTFWKVGALSLVVAFAELVLALSVSIFGVALADPKAVLSLRPSRTLLEHLPGLAERVQDQRYLILYILFLLIIVIAIKNALSVFLTWRQAKLSEEIGNKMGEQLFSGYLSAPYLWHTEQQTSILQLTLKRRIFISTFIINFLQAMTYLAITLVLLLGIVGTSLFAGGIVIGVTGIIAYFIYKRLRRATSRASSGIAHLQEEMEQLTLPTFSGIREVLIFRQQLVILSLFNELNKKILPLNCKMAIYPPLPALILEFIGGGMLVLCTALLIAFEASVASLTGTLTLIAAVAWRLLPTMNRSLGCCLNMQGAMPYVDPVLHDLDTLATLEKTSLKSEPCPLVESVRLEAVDFRYPSMPDDQPDSLRNVSICIPRGSKIGIIGVSGAGKSTLIGILTGLFPPVRGTMLVDGKTMSPERLAGWASSIGYVPQSSFLLNASIAENVAFSQWGKSFDCEKVRRCCHLAAASFIDSLPEGIGTVIGERGIRLSGGQIQKIAIARALYHDPQLLLLDEATSALDGAAEREIMQTVDTISTHMTVVIVAHRLSTVAGCDFLYWLDKGKVVYHDSPDKILPLYERFLARRTLDDDKDREDESA